MDRRTKEAIMEQWGREPIPKVAERYGVSKNTVRHIWEEARLMKVRGLSGDGKKCGFP